MVLEFSVGNFRSIKEIQTISFVASPIVSKYKEVDENNTFQATDKIRLLKSLAVYGANASGKSNFIKAITAFTNIVQDSVRVPLTLTSYIEPFLLSAKTEKEPTYFQIVFIIGDTTYRYGFEATKKDISSEWLFSTHHNKKGSKEVYLFKREFQELSVNEKQYKELHKFKKFLFNDNPIFKNTSLLISALTALNEPISNLIVKDISRFSILSGLKDTGTRAYTDDAIIQSEVFKNEMLTLLKETDISIEDIKAFTPSELNANRQSVESFNDVLKGGKDKIITTFHNKQDVETPETVLFFLDYHASEGTKKMYEIYPLVLMVLRQGMTMIIDEFDARFHPRLSQKIIDLFNNPKTNPKNAQLLVVTHDTNLLSAKTFRRDQILFVEKDKNEASRIYSLAEFKGVRNDASFEKDYLDGRYGAVPILNNFSTIFEN